jgi:hypothetical protein
MFVLPVLYLHADTAGGYVETAKDQAGKVADAAYHAPGHAYNAAADTATKARTLIWSRSVCKDIMIYDFQFVLGKWCADSQ